jgi:hypothetical protein
MYTWFDTYAYNIHTGLTPGLSPFNTQTEEIELEKITHQFIIDYTTEQAGRYPICVKHPGLHAQMIGLYTKFEKGHEGYKHIVLVYDCAPSRREYALSMPRI